MIITEMRSLFLRNPLSRRSASICSRRWHTAATAIHTPPSQVSTPAKATGKPPPARTRFAPSPTGLLHLGSLRTALFNYLYAKNTGGQFLLRIEDTDQKRTIEGAEQHIYDTLRWAGIQWDEGPDVGGPYGSYKQSERTALHQEHAQKLVNSGYAYRCFCPLERLQNLALQRTHQNLPTDYDRACTHLSGTESEERAANGEAHVIRLKAPDDYPPFHDLLYGTIQYGSNKTSHNLGSYSDPVLLKSDGMPTYHLANVVDDYFMKVTHVIRATEWMPSTPRHVYLYNCFGWQPPIFAHVGLLQNGEKKKLSKRDGDVNVQAYAEKGYLPEALNNFVALLGWSHTRQDDVMTMQDLIDEFSLDRLTVGNTIVTFDKLTFLQKAHVRSALGLDQQNDASGENSETPTTPDLNHPIIHTLISKIKQKYPLLTTTNDDTYIRNCILVNLKNLILPDQFIDSLYYFFIPSSSLPGTLFPLPAAQTSITKIKKYLTSNPSSSIPSIILPLIRSLVQIPPEEPHWTQERIAAIFPHAPDKKSDKEGFERHTTQMRFWRLVLAGAMPGPSIPDMIWVLGKRRVFERVREGWGLFRAEEMKAESEGERELEELVGTVGKDGQ